VRYLKVTLLIGFASAIVAGGLVSLGAFGRLDAALWNFLGHAAAPAAHPAVQCFAVALLAFGVAWTTIDIQKLSLKIVIAAGTLVEIIALTCVLNLHGAFFSPVASLLALALSFGGAFAYSRSEAGGRKRDLQMIFGHRISRKTFYSLLDSSLPIKFDGEYRDTTVVVCEIFNHDELMDSLPVADYVAMTNLFLQQGGEFLVEQGGYLDESDGEKLRVIFGAPLTDGSHAVTACKSALELVKRLDELNQKCHERWQKAFDFRIGINSGEVVTAAYGSNRLGTFSVAGEPVEFARRLCSANTIYGSRILIGSGTFNAAAEAIEVRPIELIRGRDDRSREEIYELLARKHDLSNSEIQRRDDFWKGVVYFREQRWEEALTHFYAAASASEANDGPLEFYVRRVEQLRAGVPVLDWENARL
jgi:class 3 adenylate cyclase